MTTTERPDVDPPRPRTHRSQVWAAITVVSVPAALLVYVALAHTAGPQILTALLPGHLSESAATSLGAVFAAVPVVLAVALLVTAHEGGRRPWARALAPVLVWWAAAVVLVFPGRNGTGSVVADIYGDLAPTVDALASGVLLALVAAVGAALVAGIVVTLAFRAPADLATWSPDATRARGRRLQRTFGWVFLAVVVVTVSVLVVVA